MSKTFLNFAFYRSLIYIIMAKKTASEKVNFHSPGSDPVLADIVNKNNENNYDLFVNGELLANILRKESCNFNQLDNLNYFTELSE